MAQQSNRDRRTAPDRAAPQRARTAAGGTSAAQNHRSDRPSSKKKRQKLRVHNKNLKYQLLTVAAVVLAVVLCLVVFFRVNHINVHNNGTVQDETQAETEAEVHSYYSAEEIIKVSGIEKGDNLLTISKEAVAAKIMAELPYISEVHIQRNLPGTVDITVSEFDVAYAVQDSFDGWWLMNRDGRILEQTTEAEANTHLTVVGLRADAPVPAEALVPEQQEDMTEQNAKLSSLIDILQQLESYAYCKQIVKIDLTASYDIRLWYGSQYEIRIGNTERLSYKLSYLDGMLKELKSYQAGVIDLTFAEDNAARFQPFSE